ncbi:MAG: chromosome segregation protein SMC [Lachnospiraceae bacterium]|nr:chromosome segregation protein SMC [Lachnospiraceae bacterium]
MYLKNIEVQGFKSFANKIDFEFHNGITAIVGPNGSGKSNVADAVRWVLGEQSAKQLRGSSMQDIIFSGTEMRKPMGYAYVAITLDNSDHALPTDYEEVTVARRVYRSGESEYLINGSTCRLKDVAEMFYDTGIGKEGYSIIGQGQIDRILSGKPEERRELFDEAAGIVKFKRRKATALKKLDQERANLVRVSDILAELERQVEPLEKQSEIAKNYLQMKEELKRLDVNIFLIDNEKAKTSLDECEQKINVATADLEAANAENDSIKEEYGNVENKIKELDEQIEEKRAKLSENSLLKEKLEGEINVLKEKINSANISGEHFRNRQKALTDEIAAKKAEEERLSAEQSSMDSGMEDLIKRRDEAVAELEKLQAQIEEENSIVEKNKNIIINLLNDRQTIVSKLGQFGTMLEQTRIRESEIQSRLISAKSEEAEQDTLVNALTLELNTVCEQIQSTDNKRESMEEKLGDYRTKLENLDRQLGDAQIAYHGIKSKLETLKNLAERYDGYGSSIKRVMEHKGKIPGIIGVVADIMQVDPKYETAIETALGGNIQNIVTKDEHVARKMIDYLKENKAGRATFLPLTTTRNRGEFDKPEVRNAAGFIGMANELVSAKSEYDDVISQLLGAIIVIDTVENALKLAKEYNYTLRIVTLEGEYLTPGGALAGGSFKNASNLLGRKREIDALNEEAQKGLHQIESIMDEIDKTKEDRAKLREEIEQFKAKLQDLYIQQNTAQMNVDAANKHKEELIAGHADLEAEFEKMKAAAQGITSDQDSAKEELAQSEKTETELNAAIAEAGAKLEKLRDIETEKVFAKTDLDLEVTKEKQKQDFAKQNVDRVKAEIQHLQTEFDEVAGSIKETELEIAEKEKSIEAIKETIAASNDSTDENEVALKEAIASKEEFTEKQKSFFDKREAVAKKLADLDKELYRLRAQKEKTEEEQESRINYMWNEYQITLSHAAEMRDETLNDPASMRKNIYKLRDSIRDLGDVNVNAIEDYKAIMERYTFTKTQHDDLVKAEQDLLGILEELDKQMKVQFEANFKLIAEEFDKVFKELFGGGTATLKINDDEDILEAGININAQPPGKKLQNMLMLSGGEKALAAISLLFAIQNLKPSPFCLLDEIEAALDESNVGRFAGYLNKLTEHTQFIVITHRRGTMEKADRLYGITMQEKGVSALVSVNLIDKDLDD